MYTCTPFQDKIQETAGRAPEELCSTSERAAALVQISRSCQTVCSLSEPTSESDSLVRCLVSSFFLP